MEWRGDVPRAALAIPAVVVPCGGLLCLPSAYPAFSFPSCPLSPRPRSQSALPRWGRGSPKVYFAGGFAPGTPAFDRLQHLQALPCKYPCGRLSFYNADSRRPTGTNAPARQGTRPLRASPTFGKPVPPGFSPRGCKGQSPLHKKTKNLPLPRRGRALCERGRGDGGRKAS